MRSRPGGDAARRRTRPRMTEDVIATRARALAGALSEAGFARLRVRDGDTEIELRRAPRAAAAPAVASTPAAEAPERPAERRADLVSSDVVGIMRHTRPPVAEGLELDGDRELGSVETLGIRNPVRSRGGGLVVAVFVTEGQPVEYGQPLFAIER
jgi:acetyl-CoA carboxylase biotin carboxyl carrier protein